MSRLTRSNAVALPALLLLIAGCGRNNALPAPSRKTPVIVISIDTLRSDHLPAYGYTGVATPNIDSLRSDSILYARAYSHCPLTLPSHASMLTGVLPAEHGLRDNLGFKLKKDVATLAEVLGRNGYVSGAAVSAFVLRRESEIGRGFDFWDDEIELASSGRDVSGIQRSGSDTTERAKKWIDAQGERPFFFMLHLYEPHSPYTAPEPFASRYRHAYDAEIAAVDAIVGDFIEFLKRKELYDRSLVILLSDHGEGLNDHGEDEHGIFLYREAIQVPLLLKLPGSRLKGRTVDQPVQLSDVFPTVAEQTASSLERKRIDGVSLLQPLRGGVEGRRVIYSESYFPRLHFGWSDTHSLTDGQHHYIHAPKPELFDLTTDPAESVNVLANSRRVYAAMRRAIVPLIKPVQDRLEVDPEEAAKLAALGYLGSSGAAAGRENLPDPKDKVEDFRRLRAGFRLFREQKLTAALEQFQKLIPENQGMLDLWDVTARTLGHLGRREEAIEAAKRGLKVAPTTTHLAVMIANLSLDLGRLEEAESHAGLVLSSQPGQGHEILARVWLARGNLDQAEKAATAALAGDANRVIALVALGRVQKERGRLQEAVATFDKAAALNREGKKSPVSGVNFWRGDALARLGRNREAEQAFKEEIRLFPAEAQAYKNLVLLYVSEGRVQEATALIFALERAAPTPRSYIAISQMLEVVGDGRGARYWARRGLRQFPDDANLRKLAAG